METEANLSLKILTSLRLFQLVTLQIKIYQINTEGIRISMWGR